MPNASGRWISRWTSTPNWISGCRVHKLFNGSQCLEGLNLTVTLDNHQINEKLRHIHLRHSGTGWQEPQISQPPFVVTENLAHWASSADLGPGLLVPEARARLVAPVEYQGQPLVLCAAGQHRRHGARTSPGRSGWQHRRPERA